MYTCASCTLRSCQKGGGDLPQNCPMRDPEFFDRLLERYWSEENHDFFVTSAAIESAGYCRSPGVPEECKLQPGQFEAMCNPIAQAELLNSQDTQFNICLGLCVGHDSLFYQYSKALVTTLVVKDRVLAHNPVGAIHYADTYFKDLLKG